MSGRSLPPPLPATVAAYVATDYCIGDAGLTVVLHLGDPCERHAGWLGVHGVGSATILTAWNPFACLAGDANNAAAGRRLKRALDDSGLAVLPALNRDPAGLWPPEAGWCIFDLGSEALDRWLVRFRQHAAVRVAVDSDCQLVWHPAIRDRIRQG